MKNLAKAFVQEGHYITAVSSGAHCVKVTKSGHFKTLLQKVPIVLKFKSVCRAEKAKFVVFATEPGRTNYAVGGDIIVKSEMMPGKKH